MNDQPELWETCACGHLSASHLHGREACKLCHCNGWHRDDTDPVPDTLPAGEMGKDFMGP